MFFRLLFVGALAGLLNACVSLPPAPEGASAPDFVVPSELRIWSANGKFSFRSPESREAGQFYWSQNDEDYLLRLIGPLGVGSAEVERGANGVTIRSRGETYEGEITEQLLLELTGISVPLSELSGILLGDTQTSESRWKVEYKSAMEVEEYLLPQRLTLTSGDQVLQIFVSRWSI